MIIGEHNNSRFFSILGFLLLIVIIFLGISEGCSTCSYSEKSELIFSLDIEDNLGGSFFLGIGSFGSDSYYYFYKESGDGMILDKVNAERTRIVETDLVSPSYVVYVCDCVLNGCDERKLPTLFVPEGTIKKDFEVK